eukprot:5908923-Amphidinium_carterae.1
MSWVGQCSHDPISRQWKGGLFSSASPVSEARTKKQTAREHETPMQKPVSYTHLTLPTILLV